MGAQFSVSLFFDAGDVCAAPGNSTPRGCGGARGVGVQLVTPFGPVGLDYAYGFDKPEPGWQLHFNLGGGGF